MDESMDVESYLEDISSTGASPRSIDRSDRTAKRGMSRLQRLPRSGHPRESDFGRAAMPNNSIDNDRPLGEIDSELDLLSEIPIDLSSPRSTFQTGQRSTTGSNRSTFNRSTFGGARTSNNIGFQRVSYKRLNSTRDVDEMETLFSGDRSTSPIQSCRGGTLEQVSPHANSVAESWWAPNEPSSSSGASNTVVAGASSLLRNLEVNGGLTDAPYVDLLSEMTQDPPSNRKPAGSPQISSFHGGTSLQRHGPAASAGSSSTFKAGTSSTLEERRIDPSMGNNAVTWDEMCQGLRDQQLSTKELAEHWASLKPKAYVPNSFERFSTPVNKSQAHDATGGPSSSVKKFYSSPSDVSPRRGWAEHGNPKLAGFSLQPTPSTNCSTKESNLTAPRLPTSSTSELNGIVEYGSRTSTWASDLSHVKGSLTDTLESKNLEEILNTGASQRGPSEGGASNTGSWEAYMSARSTSKPNTMTSDLDLMTERAQFVTACSSRVFSPTSDLDVVSQNVLDEGQMLTANSENREVLQHLQEMEQGKGLSFDALPEVRPDHIDIVDVPSKHAPMASGTSSSTHYKRAESQLSVEDRSDCRHSPQNGSKPSVGDEHVGLADRNQEDPQEDALRDATTEQKMPGTPQRDISNLGGQTQHDLSIVKPVPPPEPKKNARPCHVRKRRTDD